MTDKVRVLQVIDKIGNAGAETLLKTLAEGIDHARFELHVCGLRPRPGSITLPALQALGVPTLVLNQRSPYDLNAFLALVRYIHIHRIDLIHTHLTAADIMGRMAGFLTRRPVVSTIHSGALDLAEGPRRRQWLERWTARLWCNRLVVVSELLREEVAAWFGLPLSRVLAISNGVDTERFRPLAEPARSVTKHNLLGGDYPLVINVARLVPVKGLDQLIEAASLVTRSRPDVRFVLVGEGEQRDALNIHALELGVSSNTVFAGFRNDVATLLGASDICVLSSLWEGMPLSILEAMSAGCPVVATRVGGVPQVVRDGTTGLLVPPGDAKALARALLLLLDDPDRARKMGESARALAVQEYGIRAWAQHWEKLYFQELKLARSRSGGPLPTGSRRKRPEDSSRDRM